jgi:hypothetical protein
VSKTRLSTAVTLYGADGPMMPVTLRTVLMLSALRDVCCREESAEKPLNEKQLKELLKRYSVKR